MQTRCPHCETWFRVTDSQLARAEGYVRCGLCEEIFNVYSDDETTEQQTTSVETAPGQITPEETAAEETAPVKKASDDDLVQEEAINDFDEQNLYADDATEPDHSASDETFVTEQHEEREHLELETYEKTSGYVPRSGDEHDDEDSADIARENTDPSREESARHDLTDTVEHSIDTNFDDVNDDTVPGLDEAHPDTTSSTADNKYDDSYDLFDHHDENREHVVPDEFRSEYDDNHSIVSTVLWSIGILFLIVTLFLEYAWFNRDEYAQIPQIQTEIEKLCEQFDCNDISIRVPDRIELVSRNVYSHPNQKDGLIVDITMKNNAAFSQPYPVLKIEFSDIRGQVIASRNFLPKEYLSIIQQNTGAVETLPPDSSSNVTLEVKDPGKQAMTYEFEFL